MYLIYYVVHYCTLKYKYKLIKLQKKSRLLMHVVVLNYRNKDSERSILYFLAI